MVDIAEQMEQILRDAPLGLPVKVGTLPDQPEDVGALAQRWSTRIENYFGMTERTYIPMITLTIRSTEYTGGASWIDIASNLLNDVRIGQFDIFLTGMWAYIGRDRNQRHIFQVNFKIIVRE